MKDLLGVRDIGLKREAKKCESKEKIAKEQSPPPKQSKEYFTCAIYDSPIRTRMRTVMRSFKIKHSLTQMHSSLYELESQNPFEHIDAFLEICSTMFLNNISDDTQHLRLFPSSLKDKAKARLDTRQISSLGTKSKRNS